MTRCVRQGFYIQGQDTDGFSSDERHNWIKTRLLYLVDVFSIDLLAFAIMDNHTHTVLRTNLIEAATMSSSEVIERWSKLGKIPIYCQLYLSKDYRALLSEAEISMALDTAEKYRKKLTCISTFMSKLNSYVAKRANKEDGVKGHFWEGRFKSQALLDEKAILACMAYVDLNPIRAGKSKDIKSSKYTSIEIRVARSIQPQNTILQPLLKSNFKTQLSLPFELTLQAYIEYLQNVVKQKISEPNTVFKLDSQKWIKLSESFESSFDNSAGDKEFVTEFEKQTRKRQRLLISCERSIGRKILERLHDKLCQSDKKLYPI